jgi:hypothetical protein
VPPPFSQPPLHIAFNIDPDADLALLAMLLLFAWRNRHYPRVARLQVWLRHMAMGMALHLGDKAFAREMAEQTKDLFIGKYVSPAGYLVFEVL